MKSLVWNNEMILKDSIEPQISNENEVKIELKYSGICGTDLEVIKGHEESVTEVIRGHEGVGKIVEIGQNVSDFKVGERVVIDPNQYCGNCYYCKKGLTNFCENNGQLEIAGVNKHGVFAEYFVTNSRFVYKLPDDLTWEQSVLIEPTTCIYNNILASQLKPSDSILVLGLGPMGAICEMLCYQLARMVVGVEKNSYRRKICSELMDAVYAPEEFTSELISEITEGRGFDIVFDTTGTLLEYAMKVVAKNGRIVPLAMNKDYNFLLYPFKLISKGIKIIGASEYNMLFTETIGLIRKYPEIGKLVTGRYKIEHFSEAFDSVLKKNASNMKVVFKFD